MPIEVTRDWRQETISSKPPWTASMTWLVTGVSTGTAALFATDYQTGERPKQKGETHPETTGLKSTGPFVRSREGPFAFWVGADFVEEVDLIEGGSVTPPLKFLWEHIEVSEQVDVDLDNRPIYNGAGFPIPGGGSRPIAFKILHVWRDEPLWNYNKNVLCENAVNEAALNLGGGVSISAEHMRCSRITPDGEYVLPVKKFSMHYVFECIFDDSLGKYPFQHRFLNQSVYGWWQDATGNKKRHAKFSDGKGNVSDEPIRIGDEGLPLTTVHPDTKVGESNKTPVSPPKSVSFYKHEYYKGGQAGNAGSADAHVIYFKRVRVANFGILGLF